MEYNDRPRDPEKLLEQYQPLINSVYSQFKGNFTHSIGPQSYMQGARGQTNKDIPDTFAQSDLKSYINEQFLRLVKEYDPNGGVDFPGYIYAKLSRRVLGSYIHGRNRDNEREGVGVMDNQVERQLANSADFDQDYAISEIIKDVSDSLEDSIDKYIFVLLTDKDKKLSNYAIYLKVHSVFSSVDRADFDKRLSYIKVKTKEEISANGIRWYGRYS